MDLTQITTMCSSLGFPIVMCLLLFNYIKTEQKETRTMINLLKESVDHLVEALREKNEEIQRL